MDKININVPANLSAVSSGERLYLTAKDRIGWTDDTTINFAISDFPSWNKMNIIMYTPFSYCTSSSSSTTLVWNISHSKKNWARYYQYVDRSSCTLSFFSQFHQTWMFLKIFWKILKYYITWISIQWELGSFMQMDWQTDRHDEANSHFPKFCKRA